MVTGLRRTVLLKSAAVPWRSTAFLISPESDLLARLLTMDQWANLHNRQQLCMFNRISHKSVSVESQRQ
jgi:hypothetical protein